MPAYPLTYAGVIVGGPLDGWLLEGDTRRMWTPEGWHLWTSLPTDPSTGFWRPEDTPQGAAWQMLIAAYPRQQGLPPI